jgi:NADH-quinone oxidoreductase subunit G
VLLGSVAQSHPDFCLLRQLAANIADAAAVNLGFVGEGANSTGAAMLARAADTGLSVGDMLEQGLDACLLLNVEPEYDSTDPRAMNKLLGGAKVVALSTHLSPWLAEHADVVLPIAAFLETAGSFVNIQGDIQSFNGTARPVGEARPAWKVLRVLGNLADVHGFDYESAADVRDELMKLIADTRLDNSLPQADTPAARLADSDLQRIGGTPLYHTDMLVRRAQALQHTPDAWKACLWVNPALAQALGLEDGDSVTIRQGEGELTLLLGLDERVPGNCVWMPTGVPGSELLGEGFGAVSLEKA